MKNNLPDIRTLRPLNGKIRTFQSELRRFIRYEKLDMDVFMPSKGINLQRKLCWTTSQKQEMIYSVLLGRNIPPVAINNRIEEETYDEICEVIDGKQRLSSIISFLNDEFYIILCEGRRYYYSDLPKDWKLQLVTTPIGVMEAYDLTDDEKIEWFYFLNRAGTPQDEDYLNKIEALMKEANQ